MASEKWASLIIRVWLSENEPDVFRARLVAIDDVMSEYETIATAGDPETVLEQARLWLERVQAWPPTA